MWILDGKKIEGISDLPKKYKDAHGFIYNILTTEGREYIGRKNFFFRDVRLIGKRELAAHPDKRLLRKRKSKKGKKKGQWIYYEDRYKESDWKTYTGSNNVLNEDIEKGVGITKYILKIIMQEGTMKYEETKAILCTNALEDMKFYNNHAGNFYKKHIIGRV